MPLTRAQELRASLGARQDAEAMLAEASRIRQEAASAADAIVEEAQQLSAQLVAESRSAAEQIHGEARERADGVLARARIEAEEVAERARATADAIRAAAESDVEEHRRRVRAEVTAQVTRDLTEQHRLSEVGAREQSEALISDLEASVRILGVSLESALANVSELLGSLEQPALQRRTDSAGRVARRTRARSDELPPRRRAGGPAPRRDRRPSVPDVTSRPNPPPVVHRPRCRRPDGGRAADRSEAEPTERPTGRARPPRPSSAPAASRSSRPARELRDLQHPEECDVGASEESRHAAQRREVEDEPSDDGQDPDPMDGARPLGWLFRTAQ